MSSGGRHEKDRESWFGSSHETGKDQQAVECRPRGTRGKRGKKQEGIQATSSLQLAGVLQPQCGRGGARSLSRLFLFWKIVSMPVAATMLFPLREVVGNVSTRAFEGSRHFSHGWRQRSRAFDGHPLRQVGGAPVRCGTPRRAA